MEGSITETSQPLQYTTTSKSKEAEEMTQGKYTLHHTSSEDVPTGDITTIQCSLQKCAGVIDITNALIVLLKLLTERKHKSYM
jgi:hypothetical protein